MKSWRKWNIGLILMLAVSQPSLVVAQDAPEDEVSPPAISSEELLEMPPSELEYLLAPLTAEQLSVLSEAAMGDLQTFGTELARALIDQQRARDAENTSADDQADIDAKVSALREKKETLISRIEIVLKARKAKGGDVESAKLYISAIQNLQPVTAATTKTNTELSEEEQKAAAVTSSVDSAIAAIREQPPAHDRKEPWTVPVAELEMEFQPLRVAEVEERVKKWLELVQQAVRRRIRIDIALSQAQDPAERAELAKRSAAQHEIVQAVVQRAQVGIDVLAKRGGDVTEYKKYIATATGQKLNLTDPGVLYAQAMAWMQSREGGIKLGLNILKFFGLLLAFYILARILGRAVATAVGRVPRTSTLLRNFLVSGTRRVTMIIGLVVAVSALGVNITPLVAAIGAAGLVIGLALQGTLSNFASGILILFYRPFDVGDVINGGGVTGKVESMNLVSTSILTFDNQVMVVPNNQIWNGVITNVTGRNTRRVDLVFGIGYGDDIGRAVEVLEEVISKHEKVLADPAPVIRVHELGDNSVNIIARPWARTADYWDVHWDLMRQVKEKFDEAGINIPFPQRDLHVPGTIEVRLAGDSRQGGDGGSGKSSAAKVPFSKPSKVRSVVKEPAPAGDIGDDDESNA